MSATHIVPQSNCVFAVKSPYSDYFFSIKPPLYRPYMVVCMSTPMSDGTRLIYSVEKDTGKLMAVDVYTSELDDAYNALANKSIFVYTAEVTFEYMDDEL